MFFENAYSSFLLILLLLTVSPLASPPTVKCIWDGRTLEDRPTLCLSTCSTISPLWLASDNARSLEKRGQREVSVSSFLAPSHWSEIRETTRNDETGSSNWYPYCSDQCNSWVVTQSHYADSYAELGYYLSHFAFTSSLFPEHASKIAILCMLRIL